MPGSHLIQDERLQNGPLLSTEPIWTSGSTNSGGDGNARWIDVDKDGDMDLVTGNIGLNQPLVSTHQPLIYRECNGYRKCACLAMGLTA